jgi:hypothetical protein
VTIRTKSREGEETCGEYLSEIELRTLLGHVGQKAELARQNGTKRAIVDELMILLLVKGGLRASELCALNIGDIYMNHGDGVISIRDAKGEVLRSVVIDGTMLSRVERFVRLYRKGARSESPLLVSERGKRLVYMSVYSKVKNIGKKAGIGRLHPHMLRRTYMVRLYEAERDLRLVQEQAGHASRKTTAMYVGTRPSGGRVIEGKDGASTSGGTPSGGGSGKTTAFRRQGERELRAAGGGGGRAEFVVCEACERSIRGDSGTTIDSGQVLCKECLEEIRMKHSAG